MVPQLIMTKKVATTRLRSVELRWAGRRSGYTLYYV